MGNFRGATISSGKMARTSLEGGEQKSPSLSRKTNGYLRIDCRRLDYQRNGFKILPMVSASSFN